MAMHRWTRLSTQRMEEDWYARLSHIDPEHLLMLRRTESSALKIQVFGDKKTVEQLVCNFGGKMTHLSSEVWTSGKASSCAKPPKSAPPQKMRPRHPVPLQARQMVRGVFGLCIAIFFPKA